MQLTNNGDPWANVTISKVTFHASYGSGYLVDKPDLGNVYVQAWVSYEALTDGVDYNPFDWDLFANDVAVANNYTIVYNQPKPELGSGNLPRAEKLPDGLSMRCQRWVA